MKNFILFIFLCISAKSFGGIYSVQDNVKDCTLYFSEVSKVSKDIDINKLERESVTAALVFQKHEDKYNLKGLYGFFALERDIKIEKSIASDLMKFTFESACISSEREIVYFEKGRKLFNNLNDLDRE
jgi:hypothetical protein